MPPKVVIRPAHYDRRYAVMYATYMGSDTEVLMLAWIRDRIKDDSDYQLLAIPSTAWAFRREDDLIEFRLRWG